jgi:hypothetical protein
MRLLSLLAPLALAACMAPVGPAQRATDAARELNQATRFGRMDVALGHTAPGARSQFLDRRAHWGRGLRVVDLELAGLKFEDDANAVFQIDVAWVRDQESRLRSTRIAQFWRDGDEGWRLVRERRLAGDVGLFGEPVRAPAERPPLDVQFPTRVIR